MQQEERRESEEALGKAACQKQEIIKKIKNLKYIILSKN